MNLVPKLTVAIGAYDNPELLSQALKSVVAQSLRPLRVLVSDDAGDKSASHVIAHFREKYPDILWDYYRQPSNLGVARNLVFMFSKVSEDFCIFLQHDDELLDSGFLAQSVASMESNSAIDVCIGNALLEGRVGGKERLFYVNNRRALSLDNGWARFSGERVLAALLVPERPLKRLFRMFLPSPPVEFIASWSSVVFRTNAARETGGLLASTLVPQSLEDDLDVYTNEEGFTFLHRILAKGDALVTYDPVSFRGMPPSSFSQLPSHPGRNRRNSLEFFALLKNAEDVEALNPRVAEMMRRRAKSIGYRVRPSSVSRFLRTELSISVSPSVAFVRGWYVHGTLSIAINLRKALVRFASIARFLQRGHQ